MQNMNLLIFAHSVEYINHMTLTDYPSLVVQNNIRKDEDDFIYNGLSTKEMSEMTIPFINCNRKVFCSPSVDLISLFKLASTNIFKNIFEMYDAITVRLNFIERAICMLLSDNINFDSVSDISNSHLYISNIYSISVDKLNEKFEKLAECIIMRRMNMLKFSTYDFILELERTLDILSKKDFPKLFFGLKPSELFNNVYKEKDLNFEEFKELMSKIYIIYMRVQKNIKNLKNNFLVKEESGDYYILNSYFFNYCILLKWTIEVERVCIINYPNKLENYNHILVYTTNVSDILLGELTILIKSILDVETDEERKLFGLTMVSIPNYKGGTMYIDSYEFKLSNDKRYIIKIFDLEKINQLPPGLSTAYLNFKTGFESLGFMGVSFSKDEFKYSFLSVEENTGFYLAIYNLKVFKSNVIQVFYFILYVLDLLNLLYVYRIQLWYKFTIAVDSNDDKKWRFRLDEIEMFNHHKNEDLFRNRGFLISIINKFIGLFTNQSLRTFFKNLKNVADKLESSKDKDFFAIMSNMVKYELDVLMINDELRNLIVNDELKNLDDMQNSMDTNMSRCCVIQ